MVGRDSVEPATNHGSTESRPTVKRLLVQFFSAACSHRFSCIACQRGGRFRLLLASPGSFPERDPFPDGAHDKRLLVLRPTLRNHFINGTAR